MIFRSTASGASRRRFTLRQVHRGLDGGAHPQYLLNSFIITIPSLIGMLFLSSLNAYALARFKFRGNLLIYFIYVAGRCCPSRFCCCRSSASPTSWACTIPTAR